MAEYSQEEGALLQYQLAEVHKQDLAALSLLLAGQLTNIFDALAREDDETFAKGVRQMYPELMNASGRSATRLAANYYDEARDVYALTDGAVKAVEKPFLSTPDDFLVKPFPEQIITSKMDEIGFQFHEVFDLGKPLQEVRTPMIQIAQRAPLDFSLEAVKFEMGKDDAAKEEPKRQARKDGCNFCKHMATFVGVSDEQAGKFHKGCGCSASVAWAYEMDYRPDWADEYEDQFYARQKEINDKNAELTLKTRQVIRERINSKGKLVREKKVEKYYVDKNGKETKPEPTSTDHIINTIPRLGK